MSDAGEIVTRAVADVQAAANGFKIRSTSIFYSNPWLTLQPGNTYLVGQNPGGTLDIASQTEAKLRDQVRNRPWSAYLDEPGWQKDNLQRNLGLLADAVFDGGRTSLRSVFSTNAIFFRDSGGLTSAAAHYFDACWPTHLEFLRSVTPTRIITIGNGSTSAYSLFSGRMSRKADEGEIPLYSTFSIRALRGELGLDGSRLSVLVVGLPHLSYCNVTSRPAAVAAAKAKGWL